MSCQELTFQLWIQLEKSEFSSGFRELLDLHNILLLYTTCLFLSSFPVNFWKYIYLFTAPVDSISHKKPGKLQHSVVNYPRT